MLDRFIRTVSFAAGFSALALPAWSATMTFKDITVDPVSETYFEDGILAEGNGMLGLYSSEDGPEGIVHMDDSGTGQPTEISFSMARNFNAISFLMDPVGFLLKVNYYDGTYGEPIYQNALVQGFRDGALVANLSFSSGSVNNPYVVKLDESFQNLSSLLIGIEQPDLGYFLSLPNVDNVEECSPCSHFNIDNVVLAEVPLPTGLPLVASGLAVLAFLARRRKRPDA